jgi:ribosomal protein S18 acetylase RimI-like enzyme
VIRKPGGRRGLGLALLRHAFGEFRQLGECRAGLGVDADNPSGATRLYERAVQVLYAATVYEKELT